jgi:hypothetical protein
MIEGLFVVALLGAVVPAHRLLPGREPRRAEWRAIVGGAVLLAAAMPLTPGSISGILAIPWLVVVLARAIGRVAGIWKRRASLAHLADGLVADAAMAYLAVGAVWAVISRVGLRPLDFDDRIVLLTAVHFHVAGFVLVVAGEVLRRRHPSPLTSLALVALVIGIPTTALGFLGVAAAGLIGGWLVSIGGLLIGLGHLRAAARGEFRARGLAATVAGLSLLLTMPLAAAWATASTFAFPFVPLPAMAAIHGGLNVLGFALPVVYAWRGACG